MARDRSSKKKLLVGAQRHYPRETLFDRIARAVCRAECLPRKELYETWEVARRVRRRIGGGRGPGRRIVDLACGHGLLAHVLALLDTAVDETVAVDRRLPPSCEKLRRALGETWPHLPEHVQLVQSRVQAFPLREGDLVVSAHACGALTDVVLDRAAEARASVAVLPCCSDHSRLDRGGLDGWVDGDLAIDVVRAVRLRERGYTVWTQTIPADITPKNRLLLAKPRAGR